MSFSNKFNIFIFVVDLCCRALYTDTSNYTTSAILKQDDALGHSHPVAFYLKSLQPAKHNYEIHNKELLAIIHALHHFHHYLQGNEYTTRVFSDYANL
jgi:hypothetical protein